MKRILSIVLVLFILFSTVACDIIGGNNGGSDNGGNSGDNNGTNNGTNSGGSNGGGSNNGGSNSGSAGNGGVGQLLLPADAAFHLVGSTHIGAGVVMGGGKHHIFISHTGGIGNDGTQGVQEVVIQFPHIQVDEQNFLIFIAEVHGVGINRMPHLVVDALAVHANGEIRGKILPGETKL